MVDTEKGEKLGNREVKLVVFVIGDDYGVNHTSVAEVEVHLELVSVIVLRKKGILEASKA